MKKQNKKKIINDPVHGFISIQSELIFDLIEHPWLQRLRRIRQLGMTYLVYPGANHNRFQHVLGAMHLITEAIKILKTKGIKITNEEAEATQIAILLHDLGHGPFSHTLEKFFVQDLNHEEISLLFMSELNKQFDGKLTMAIQVFQNEYHKKFLHQLVSSQLDMDRIDYLCRDSFFTGVSEGVIGSDRIIKMLNVVEDQIVIEAKGIYSVEKFLIARRLMYWQVYLHKTVISIDQSLHQLLRRARYLLSTGYELQMSPILKFFLQNDIRNCDDLLADSQFRHSTVLELFARLDDQHIYYSISEWTFEQDRIMNFLANTLYNRKLFRIQIFPDYSFFNQDKIEQIKHSIRDVMGFDADEITYIFTSDIVSNKAYDSSKDNNINILMPDNSIIDIAKASDISNVSVLSNTVRKYFICYPKVFSIIP